LNGYPYFYYFRWHLLQHYAQLAQHAEAGGEHPVEARRALDRMIACDSESGNRYGLRRGSLMKLLLEGTDEGFERFEVTALEAMRLEMEQCGYRFERDLLARLIRQEGRVSHGELAAIFRYYPFVHQ
jgi:hypothetical protein